MVTEKEQPTGLIKDTKEDFSKQQKPTDYDDLDLEIEAMNLDDIDPSVSSFDIIALKVYYV